MTAGGGKREAGGDRGPSGSNNELPPASHFPRPARKRLGVIGTFVWDTIYGRGPLSEPIEEWGGITYALSGLDAALSDEWEIVPLIKVGSDLAERAREFLRGLRRVAPDAALIEVPYPNNRVELRYETSERRCERLSGGIPGWSWLGLKPLLHGLDALYVNFLSGWELDLETATLLRQHFRGPIYADMHMLLWSVQAGGMRALRPLPDVAAWCRCVDVMQVNEDEMSMMAPDPMALAATAMREGVRCLVVTLAGRGAVYFVSPGFERLDDPMPPLSAAVGPIRTALVPAPRGTIEGDPTGCGDVWGATYFSRLLAGDTFAHAMQAAHRAAARNVEHRGATGLARHLRGELIPG